MARVRAQSATGDYTFGQSARNFLVNSPDMVRQKIQTRLRLWEGEWFLDKTEGTAWLQQVVGKNKNPTYDLVIQQRILETEGVMSIVTYNSNVSAQRKLSVTGSVMTIYSDQPVEF